MTLSMRAAHKRRGCSRSVSVGLDSKAHAVLPSLAGADSGLLVGNFNSSDQFGAQITFTPSASIGAVAAIADTALAFAAVSDLRLRNIERHLSGGQSSRKEHKCCKEFTYSKSEAPS